MKLEEAIVISTQSSNIIGLPKRVGTNVVRRKIPAGYIKKKKKKLLEMFDPPIKGYNALLVSKFFRNNKKKKKGRSNVNPETNPGQTELRDYYLDLNVSSKFWDQNMF